MRVVLQRVQSASVLVDGDCISSIRRGYLLLLGVGQGDTEAHAQRLWDKLSKLRLFEDQAGKTNLSLFDVGGELLVVSQFTLYANCKKGNRPSFTDAMEPVEACRLYEYFCGLARAAGLQVQTGSFGASMQVNLVNDGPFTVILDTDSL